ncbi:hypothetical protein DQK91_15210 [Oceanidesulfovibrio marinus]|uniref:Class II aldolase/adducin N-terminal domain-containing protein n=2 Tax=Oceanidesulfovibrio marinus TaxID=370038 RepID=A0A6P1ZGR7_9BACT|nr:hypothetical protein DQK91_15210 [Oceanidesulfovibrio marinus]
MHNFLRMSKAAGGRFDLVQAGGGNSSFKPTPSTMLIKASGTSLSDMTTGSGYVEVSLPPLLELLEDQTLAQQERRERDQKVAQRLGAAMTTVGAPARPSIETLMHAMLGTYVLHTHPIALTTVACHPSWRNILASSWPEAMLVPYCTPGLDLALAMRQARKAAAPKAHSTEVFFLQNHGLIVAGEKVEELQKITDRISFQLEAVAGLDLSLYRLAGRVAESITNLGGEPVICQVCRDKEILDIVARRPELLIKRPIFPDQLVYNGICATEVPDLDDTAPLQDYTERFGKTPCVVLHVGHVFLIAPNIRKCQDMESVLKAHLMALESLGPEAQCLCDEELAYLGDYELEKYRKKL